MIRVSICRRTVDKIQSGITLKIPVFRLDLEYVEIDPHTTRPVHPHWIAGGDYERLEDLFDAVKRLGEGFETWKGIDPC